MPPRRLSRAPRVLFALFFVLVGAAVVLHAWLQSDGVRARVVERVVPRLEAALGPVRLGETFQVGWTGEVLLGPLEVLARDPGAPPVLRIERIQVTPRLGALLSGRVEARQVVLSGVFLEAGASGEQLRALLERERPPTPDPSPTAPPTTPREWPALRLDEVYVRADPQDEPWGPFTANVQVEETPGGPQLRAEATMPGGGQASLSARRSEAGLSATLEARDVPAGSVASLARAPLEVVGGVLGGSLRLDGSGATFSLELKDLGLRGPQLAPEPVGPLNVFAEGQLHWDRPSRRVTLAETRVSLGGQRELQVDVTGEATWREEPRFSVQARLRPLSFAQLLAALPPALVPETDPETGYDVALARQPGTLQGSLDVSGPLHPRRDWQVKAKLELPRRKASDTSETPLDWLRRSFDYRPLTAEGRGRRLRIGPDNPAFVPFDALPPLLVRAVLRSEDGGFWTHPGFDFDSLRTVLLAPRDGKVRGGSTLTQQLAKNLFLSREKTYARKVKEALLTLGLEAALPKQRLLELYFNLIEWGPGLYGLGEAAPHYFGKSPRALSVRESAFLATIIPNPVRYHGYCTQGALSDAWARNVDILLQKLLADGDLGPADYQTALAERLVFACPSAQ